MWLVTGGKSSHRTNITNIYLAKYIRKIWRIVFNEISKTVWTENFVYSEHFMNTYETKKRRGTPVLYIPFNTKIPRRSVICQEDLSPHLPDKSSSIKTILLFNTP